MLVQKYLKMLKSVATEYHKKGLMVIHFVNASPQVAESITATLPSADIAFLPKVKLIHLIKTVKFDQALLNF